MSSKSKNIPTGSFFVQRRNSRYALLQSDRPNQLSSLNLDSFWSSLTQPPHVFLDMSSGHSASQCNSKYYAPILKPKRSTLWYLWPSETDLYIWRFSFRTDSSRKSTWDIYSSDNWCHKFVHTTRLLLLTMFSTAFCVENDHNLEMNSLQRFLEKLTWSGYEAVFTRMSLLAITKVVNLIVLLCGKL